MKKKSKAATLINDASAEGPRPHLVAMTTTPNRYTIIRLACPKYGAITPLSAVQAITNAEA